MRARSKVRACRKIFLRTLSSALDVFSHVASGLVVQESHKPHTVERALFTLERCYLSSYCFQQGHCDPVIVTYVSVKGFMNILYASVNKRMR